MEPNIASSDKPKIAQDNLSQKNIWQRLKSKIILSDITAEKETQEKQTSISTFRGKIYKYYQGKWWDKGTGDCRFTKANQINKVRFIVRKDKTHRVIVNHFIVREGSSKSNSDPMCDLQPLPTLQSTWCWSCVDFSEGAPQIQVIAVKTCRQDFKRFKQAFDKAIDTVYNINAEMKPEDRKLELENIAKKAKEQRYLEKSNGPVPKNSAQQGFASGAEFFLKKKK